MVNTVIDSGFVNLKRANQLFRSGDFQEALDLYLKCSNELGGCDVQLNIELCKRRMGVAPLGAVVENDTRGASSLNKYFDCVYLVNLEHKHQNRLTAAAHLKNRGVNFKLFNAVNGYVGECLKQFNEYKNKPLASLVRFSDYNHLEVKRGGRLIESPGAMGYIHTYLAILADAKNRGWRKFLILEDDVILSRNFEEDFQVFINKIPADWKILNLGASQYGWEGFSEAEALANGYYYPGRRDGFGTCGSFAIAFDQEIVDEVVDNQSFFEAPFDHLPMSDLYNKYIGKCFVAYPNLVMPDVSDSSIRGKRDQFKHSELMKWRVENFTYPLPQPILNIAVTNSSEIKYLPLFFKPSLLPCDVRFYYQVGREIRPLHSIDVLELDCNLNMVDLSSEAVLPRADFTAKVLPNRFLTEDDIVQFVEFKTGVRNINSSCLVDFECNSTSVVPGRVSVILPTYKRPQNLAAAISSVVSQDYYDIELLVVCDNGLNSPFNDETDLVVSKFVGVSSNCSVRLIKHEFNRNGAAARNSGILASTGEYICFLDDDDVYLPDRISSAVVKLNNSPDKVGAVYCGFLGWNSQSNDLSRYKTGDLTRDILMLDYKKHYLHTNTATYKRDAVIRINGFDESYRRHQDLEFNLRFFEFYEIDAVKQVLVRLNPTPSGVDNKIYGFDMVLLKIKFMRQFRDLIFRLGEEDARLVLEKQFNELERYSGGKLGELGVFLIKFQFGFSHVSS